MKLRLHQCIFGFFILVSAACSNFGGVVGNTNRAYVSNYNYPALRTVPYDDDPAIENRTPYRRKVKVCSGKTDTTGFKCAKNF